MYSDLTSVFLNNLRALRFYVKNVEKNIETSILQQPTDGVALSGMLMHLAMRMKKNNIDMSQISFSNEIPIDVVDLVKKTILDITNQIQEKDVDGKKVYQYVHVSKDIKKEYQKYEIAERQEEILYSGSLMLLITYFENLVAGVLKKDFIKHPQRVSLDTKSVSYKMLLEFENVDTIKNYLIEQEVINKMYDSLEEWKKFFQKQLKLELLSWDKSFQKLQEVMARRNLFVHNNGIINNIYINLVKDSASDKIGKYVGVDKDYIDSAIDLIEYNGISLVIEAWIKEYANNDAEVNGITNMIYDEYLMTERWEMAKQLYEICLKSNKLCNADRILCQINRWQCYKWLGEYDKVKQEVDSMDLSALKTIYILGIFALKEKYDEFFNLYDSQDEIGIDELKEWPLFIGLRESEQYRKRFLKDEIEYIDNSSTEEVANN